MKLIKIHKSKAKGKKYTAVFLNAGKQYVKHFGATGYSDYTIHKNKDRRSRYLARHKPYLLKAGIDSPAYLSYYILWGPYTSIKKNISYYKNKFNL